MRVEVHSLLRHSPASRAVLKVLQASHRCTGRGLTQPAMEWIMRDRHAPSTIRHAFRVLEIAGLIVTNGGRVRLKGGGLAAVYVPSAAASKTARKDQEAG